MTQKPPFADMADDSSAATKIDSPSPQQPGQGDASNLSAVADVPVKISAVLGKSSMSVSELLSLSEGSVIELDRKIGDAIDIYVNNRLVARGEVVMVDGQLGVTMTEIVKQEGGL